MDKKRTILKEAARLFAERGFNETCTAEIAKAANTATGTIFYHFKTKEGILSEIYHNLVEEYLHRLDTLFDSSKSGLENVKAMIAFNYEFSKEFSAEFTVLHRDMPAAISLDQRYEIIRTNSERNVAFVKMCVEKGIEDGSIRKDTDADAFGRLFKAIMVGTARLTNLKLLEFEHPEKTVTEFCVRALENREDK